MGAARLEGASAGEKSLHSIPKISVGITIALGVPGLM